MIMLISACYSIQDAGTCAARLPELTSRLAEAQAVTALAPVWTKDLPWPFPATALPAAGWPVEAGSTVGLDVWIDAAGVVSTGYGGELDARGLQDALADHKRYGPVHVRIFAAADAPIAAARTVVSEAAAAARITAVARQSPQPVLVREPVPAAFAEGVAVLEGDRLTMLPADFEPFPGLFDTCPVDFEAVAVAPAAQKAALVPAALREGYARCGCQEPVSHWVWWYQYVHLPPTFLTDHPILPGSLPETGTWGAYLMSL
jgi:hypothetical protein